MGQGGGYLGKLGFLDKPGRHRTLTEPNPGIGLGRFSSRYLPKVGTTQPISTFPRGYCTIP